MVKYSYTIGDNRNKILIYNSNKDNIRSGLNKDKNLLALYSKIVL